ncbi:MAG: LysE family translocator [Acidobacteria bacterium]|nr:LysE family translocator [Acidobacteriota bacterium]MYA45658.1 LysE family translocator [Acidobacteriota bacterium]MYB32211.1 LysE family translocator [Acidobacteriota bacterium]MYH23279.1 LysE family translocator [Acidobacteriota bacterium]MYI37946.1 LysE family translocator [Acidobacteriota bacterium]
MTLAQLLAFNVTLLVAMFSPGPALLVAVQTNLSSGRRAGIAVGCGLGLMAATWTLMALIGFAAVFELFPAAYAGARIAGALYLLYIAYRMWRGASAPAGALPEPARRAFRQGLLINVFNPKAVLFAAAVLIAIFPGGLGAVNSALIAFNHLLIELSFYTALAFCLNTEAVAGRYLRAKTWIDRGAAAVLGALGLRILLSR